MPPPKRSGRTRARRRSRSRRGQARGTSLRARRPPAMFTSSSRTKPTRRSRGRPRSHDRRGDNPERDTASRVGAEQSAPCPVLPETCPGRAGTPEHCLPTTSNASLDARPVTGSRTESTSRRSAHRRPGWPSGELVRTGLEPGAVCGPTGDPERIAARQHVADQRQAAKTLRAPVEIESSCSRGRSCGRSVVPSTRPATIVSTASSMSEGSNTLLGEACNRDQLTIDGRDGNHPRNPKRRAGTNSDPQRATERGRAGGATAPGRYLHLQ